MQIKSFCKSLLLYLLSFKELRRKKIRNLEFPRKWQEVLQKEVHFFSDLPIEDQSKLLDDIKIFINEKTFEGCAGFEITDEVKLIIAAQACLLILHKNANYYPNVSTILVYPSAFKSPENSLLLGDKDNSNYYRSGEAWYQDYVILSWEDVLRGGQDSSDGHNVVFHEFAHQLDLMDVSFDGVPHLPKPVNRVLWKKILNREYSKLVKDAARNHQTLIDYYGAVSEEEFFACISEVFFEQPKALKRQHRQLFDILLVYYELNPLNVTHSSSLQALPEKWPSYLKTSDILVEDTDLFKGAKELKRLMSYMLFSLFGLLGLILVFDRYFGPLDSVSLQPVLMLGVICTVLLATLRFRRGQGPSFVVKRRP